MIYSLSIANILNINKIIRHHDCPVKAEPVKGLGQENFFQDPPFGICSLLVNLNSQGVVSSNESVYT